MIEHRSPISGVATSHDGRWVATSGYDNQVILWDSETKTAVARGFHDHLANQATFNREGSLLATASSDHTARLWSVPSMKLVAVLSDHDDDVEMVAFCPGSPHVATASRDGRVRVFGIDGSLQDTFVGHEADVISIAWAADGVLLTSSSDDGTVRRWDTSDSTAAPAVVDLGGIETDTIALTPDGRVFAGNDEGAVIIITDEGTAEVPAHASGIKRLVLSPSGSTLASLSYDRTMKMWRITEDGIVLLSETGFPSDVWARSAGFLNDTRMVFGTFGSSYAEYDASTDTWDTQKVRPTGGVNAVTEIAGDQYTVGDAGCVRRNGEPLVDLGSLANFITQVGDMAVAGGQTGQVFDVRTGEVLYQHHSPLNCGASFERDGVPHVVIGAYTGEGVVFRRAGDGLELVTSIALHDNAVKGLASDGSTIFSVCATGAAAWHSVDDFAHVAHNLDAHDKIANGCCVVAAGTYASVSRDLLLRLWDGQTAEVLPTPHTHSIKCVAASDDGRYVASGSYNGRVSVYNRETATWSNVSRPTAHGLSTITWSRKGNCFIVSSYDGAVYPVEPNSDDVSAPVSRDENALV